MAQELDRKATEYLWGHEMNATHERMARRTAESEAAFLLPHLRPGMRVLDLGSGPGTITVGLARAVGPDGEVVGVDLSKDEVERGRRLADYHSITNVRFEQADATALPFGDGEFDAVFTSALLTWLPRPAEGLAELFRVLKSGGIAAVREPAFSHGSFMLSGPRAEEFKPLLVDMNLKMFISRGLDLSFAFSLRTLVHRAGFSPTRVSLGAEVFGDDEGVDLLARLTAEGHSPRVVEPLVKEGLVTQAQVEAVRAWIPEWAASPESFALIPMVQALGWKP